MLTTDVVYLDVIVDVDDVDDVVAATQQYLLISFAFMRRRIEGISFRSAWCARRETAESGHVPQTIRGW